MARRLSRHNRGFHPIPRGPSVRTVDPWPQTEHRVAVLAASGLTNRQVAEQAFISPKTVEENLAKVYGKLGISSRAELGARMQRDA